MSHSIVPCQRQLIESLRLRPKKNTVVCSVLYFFHRSNRKLVRNFHCMQQRVRHGWPIEKSINNNQVPIIENWNKFQSNCTNSVSFKALLVKLNSDFIPHRMRQPIAIQISSHCNTDPPSFVFISMNQRLHCTPSRRYCSRCEIVNAEKPFRSSLTSFSAARTKESGWEFFAFLLFSILVA